MKFYEKICPQYKNLLNKDNVLLANKSFLRDNYFEKLKTYFFLNKNSEKN